MSKCLSKYDRPMMRVHRAPTTPWTANEGKTANLAGMMLARSLPIPALNSDGHFACFCIAHILMEFPDATTSRPVAFM